MPLLPPIRSHLRPCVAVGAALVVVVVDDDSTDRPHSSEGRPLGPDSWG